MFKTKSKFIAPTLAMLLFGSSLLYADKIYTIEDMSVKEALEKISKESKLSYIVDEELIEGKKAKNIKNIEGTKKALEKVLNSTNLEAIIEDGTILIREKREKNTSNNGNDLGSVEVLASNSTEGTGSYTIDTMNTATRLNLLSKDTPQSITVVTNQEIEDKNINSFRNLADNVVGLNAPVWDSDRVWISSRGFSIDYYQLNGIPTTYDGFATEQDMVIYDRVEIVKGASGLISGAGSPGASINMVRKHVHSKEFTGGLTLKGGSWDTYSGTMDLTIPLNEDGSIRSRVIAQKEHQESFRNFYEKDTDIIYGIIDADLSDQTKISAGASYVKTDTSGSTWSGVPIYFSDGSLTNFDPSTSFAPNWASYDKESTSAFVNFGHNFYNDIKVNANYNYQKNIIEPKTVAFMGYLDKNTGLGLESVWGVWNQEVETTINAFDIYASIPFDLGNQNHEIIVGAMTSKTDSLSYSKDASTGDINAQSIYSWDGNIEEPSYSDKERSGESSVEQNGIYVVGRFDLMDDLKLIAGGRISNYEYSCIYGCSSSYKDTNVFTPYAGLIYSLNENHSVYTSYTSIFTPQTQKDVNGDRLDPKDGNSYEVGLKSQFFDERLDTSISLFKIVQDNVPESVGMNDEGETYYRGVEGVTSKGIEITAKGEITDNWNVNFGISSFTLKDGNGQKTSTLTPRKEIMLSTKYKLGNLSFGGTINWQDKIYSDTKNPSGNYQTITQKDFYLVNLMAKYEFSEDLSLQLNIDNLFDKEYYSNILYGSYRGGSFQFGDPRKTILTLKYTF
ncbi:TonB-dependent siderophore receptor [Halarcobacter mediterraneus]|nr:TonB-dependent siderophore receptor [Halarcobacter mediterraneus]